MKQSFTNILKSVTLPDVKGTREPLADTVCKLMIISSRSPGPNPSLAQGCVLPLAPTLCCSHSSLRALAFVWSLLGMNARLS